jgi:heat shock protein beta
LQEYENFFKAITREERPPLTYVHFTAEGDNGAFKAVVFLPEAPPYSQFDTGVRQKGVKLYVRRVFITEELDALLPKYLGFLRGVVDSDDLPLNLSRETLQEHKALVRPHHLVSLPKRCLLTNICSLSLAWWWYENRRPSVTS